MAPSPDQQSAGKSSDSEAHPGEIYLEWLRHSVEDGTIRVNEKDSVLHVLAQFVFLVSPGCFYRYMSVTGEEAADKDRLQKSFESLSIHHSRNGKGLFHYHQYDSPDKSGRFMKVSGYMIKADIIFKKVLPFGQRMAFSQKITSLIHFTNEGVMKKTCSFEELIEAYFFSKTLRAATEWSYKKVLKTFLNFAS